MTKSLGSVQPLLFQRSGQTEGLTVTPEPPHLAGGAKARLRHPSCVGE